MTGNVDIISDAAFSSFYTWANVLQAYLYIEDPYFELNYHNFRIANTVYYIIALQYE